MDNAAYRPPNPFGVKPAYWERILEMRLLDDLFMRAALDDNPEAVQLILRIIIALYHIDRIIAETGEQFGDRAHIVYANGAYRGETAIGRLMADFRAKDPEAMYYPALAKRVRHLKYSERGVSHMCRAMESLVQEERELGIRIGLEKGLAEGLEKGRTERQLENLRSVMENTDWSLDQAMSVLNIPMDERQKYRELLERQS